MQDSLHSHWESTDEDELPVRITDTHTKVRVQKSAGIPRAKRSPAAIVGVGLFLAAGTALFMGANGLMGQVMTDEIEVIITQDGVEPSVVTALPGETITWINEAGIPHILQSETLPTDDGEPFNTTAIFPQSDYSYTIPLTAEAGMHDYISSTSEAIAGQIIIEEAEEPVETAEETPKDILEQIMSGEEVSNDAEMTTFSETSSSASTTIEYGSTSEVSSAQASSTETVATTVPGVIPQNPNTVAQRLNPLPAGQQSSSKAATQTPLHAAAVTQHMPYSNPQTGMAVWVLGAITLASLAGVTWKASRNV